VTDEKVKLREQYEAALAQRHAYEYALQDWRDSAAVRDAPKKLADTMHDLEHRGLLQYEGSAQRYDLHPIVRGVVVGSMKAEDKERYAERMVSYVSSGSSAHNWVAALETPDSPTILESLKTPAATNLTLGFPCLRIVSFRLRNITVLKTPASRSFLFNHSVRFCWETMRPVNPQF